MARRTLRLFGWTVVGRAPDVPHYVIAGAPHTSNWDFVMALLVGAALELPLRWVGKDSLFRGPMGPVMRFLGGLPVDRTRSNGAVRRLAEVLQGDAPIALAIAPEGTRGRVHYWKTGFYRIALAADVPIALGFVDYGRRRAGIGPVFHPSGDLEADFERIRTFFAGVVGRHPERQHAPSLPPPPPDRQLPS